MEENKKFGKCHHLKIDGRKDQELIKALLRLWLNNGVKMNDTLYSHEFMQDAIEIYVCNCESCCSALYTNRCLDKKNEDNRKKFLRTLLEYLE